MAGETEEIIAHIWSEINQANTILLCCHPRPDPDSVAANLAMAIFLSKLGKTTTVLAGDDVPPPSLKFLPHYSDIVSKRFDQVRLADYDLFVSIDAGRPERVASKSQLPLPLPIRTVVIDHHPDNPGFGNINWIEPQASSSSELVWRVIDKARPEAVDRAICTCVFTGVWSDSYGLANATPEALQILSRCLEKGVSPRVIALTLNQMRANQIKIMGTALANSRPYLGGRLVVASLKYTDFKHTGIADDEIGECKEHILYQLSRCQEAYITSLVYEYLPQSVSISLRSNNPNRSYDVSQIAKSLGGGGHPVAAAGKFTGSTEEAEKRMVDAVRRAYPGLDRA